MLLFLLVCATGARGQGGAIQSITFGPNGFPKGGVAVTVCASNATITNGVCSPAESDANCCFTDSTLATRLAVPSPPNQLATVVSDGLGNYSVWAVPGQYKVSYSGARVTASTLNVPVACVPSNTVQCGGLTNAPNTWSAAQTFTGAVTAGSVNNFLCVDGTKYTTIAGAQAALGSQGGTVGGEICIPPNTTPLALTTGVDFTGQQAWLRGTPRASKINFSGAITALKFGASASGAGTFSGVRGIELQDTDATPSASAVGLQIGNATNGTTMFGLYDSRFYGNQPFGMTNTADGIGLLNTQEAQFNNVHSTGWKNALHITGTGGAGTTSATSILGSMFQGSVNGILADNTAGAVGDFQLGFSTLQGNNVGLNGLAGNFISVANHYENVQGTSPSNISLANGAAMISVADSISDTADTLLAGTSSLTSFGTGHTTVTNNGTGLFLAYGPRSFSTPLGTGRSYQDFSNGRICYSSGGIGNAGTTGGGNLGNATCLGQTFAWQGYGRYSADNVFRLWTTASDPGNGPLQGDLWWRTDTGRLSFQGSDAAAHRIVSEDQTQTLTNKTLTSPVINGPISGAGVEETFSGFIPVTTAIAIMAETGLTGAHTLKNVASFSQTVGSGCTTFPVISIRDETSNSLLVGLTLSATAFSQSSTSVSMTAGDIFSIKVTTAAAGCTTSPANINFIAVYQ